MIMVDATIVTIALPSIRQGLSTDLTGVMWVTSAYLLTYVVPLLVSGRLGDMWGPKRMYLLGLTVFTTASVACALATTIGALIAARAVQGLGAACISPQTMTAITRLFPGRARGPAMSVWGATAGVASLIGPLLGGIITDSLGWQWIFFINVPVGVVGFIVAWRYVPRFPVGRHRMDWIGVGLSTVAVLLVVFAIQEGERFDWGVVLDGIALGGAHIPVRVSIAGMIAAGVVILACFVVWEIANKHEPLIPMTLFRERNFTLASAAVAVQSCAVTAAMLPVIMYLQTARELSPTQSALILAPSALMSVVMARPVGRLILRVDPKLLAVTGFALSITSVAGFSWAMHAHTPYGWLLLASAASGAGGSLVWSPLSLLATYHLPPERTGAGSGVYNTARQVGAVLGSASITAMMAERIAARLGSGTTEGASLPAEAVEPFSQAMAESVLLPGTAMVIGLVLSLFFGRLPSARGTSAPQTNAAPGNNA